MESGRNGNIKKSCKEKGREIKRKKKTESERNFDIKPILNKMKAKREEEKEKCRQRNRKIEKDTQRNRKTERGTKIHRETER